MLVPPINDYLDERILPSLGFNVKSSNQCRYSEHACGGDIYVYDDAMTGNWFYCPTCEMHGDTLQIYQQTRALPTVDAALACMNAEGFTADAKLKPKLIQDYIKIHGYYQELEYLWTECKNMEKDWRWWAAVEILKHYGLYDEKFDNISWLRILTRDKLKELDAPLEYTTIEGNPSKKWSVAIAVPCYDMPKRITGFFLITEKGILYARLKLTPPGYAGHAGSGLALLDSCLPWADVAYITDNVIAGLCLRALHWRGIETSRLSMAITCPGYTDDLAVVQGNSVTYWSDHITDATLISFYDNSRITKVLETQEIPVTRKEILKQLSSTLPIRYMSLVSTGGVDIAKMIASRISIEAGPHLLNAIRDNEKLRHDIRDRVDADVWERLKSKLVDSTHKSRGIKCLSPNTSGSIEERDDGYYSVDTGLRISNMKINIDAEYVYITSGNIRQRGTLSVDGRTAPFDVTHSGGLSYERLLKLISTLGLGVAHVMRTYQGEQLFAVARGMRRPEHHTVIERVGWDAQAKSYDFPRMRIKQGKIEDIPAPLENLPWCGTYLNDKECSPHRVYRDLKAVDDITAESLCFWQMFTCIVHNLVAEELKFKPVSIGLVCTPQTQSAIDTWLYDTMNLTSIPIRGHNLGGFDHGVPGLYIPVPGKETHSAGQLILSSAQLNAMIKVTPLMAHIGRLFVHWEFISIGPDAQRAANMKHAWRLVPLFLKWFHGRPRAVVYTESLQTISDEILTWLLEGYDKDEPIMTNVAKAYRTARNPMRLTTVEAVATRPKQFARLIRMLAKRNKNILKIGEKQTTIAISQVNNLLKASGCPGIPGSVIDDLYERGLILEYSGTSISIDIAQWRAQHHWPWGAAGDAHADMTIITTPIVTKQKKKTIRAQKVKT